MGATLGALIASFVLPFEQFAAWVRSWLLPKNKALHEGIFKGVNRKYIADPNCPRGFMYSLAEPPTMFVSPRDYAALQSLMGST
jgi:hypothetical protein